MNFKEKIIHIKDKILESIFPSDIKCILCGKDIPNFDMPFCEDCLNNNIFNNGNRCSICDMQIKEGNIVCDHCKEKKRSFKKCVCPLNYENKVRQALIKFKSDNAKYLAQPFAELIVKRLKEDKINFDIIVPVPSHKKTIKQRGYNPAMLIAENISKLTQKPVKDVLCKNVLTKNQKLLNYQQRQENLQNSIILLNKEEIKDKIVLIVDDVVTTGATLEICASLLKSAKEIYTCAVARNQIK